MKRIVSVLGLAGLLFSCTPAQKESSVASEEKNTVIETIMSRRSVRKYQPQAVNRDTMQIITECGGEAIEGFLEGLKEEE